MFIYTKWCIINYFLGVQTFWRGTFSRRRLRRPPSARAVYLFVIRQYAIMEGNIFIVHHSMIRVKRWNFYKCLTETNGITTNIKIWILERWSSHNVWTNFGDSIYPIRTTSWTVFHGGINDTVLLYLPTHCMNGTRATRPSCGKTTK